MRPATPMDPGEPRARAPIRGYACPVSKRGRRWLTIPAIALLGGCGTAAIVTTAPTQHASAAASYPTKPTQSGQINEAAVPLGDGYRSTAPKVGYVDSCITKSAGSGGSNVDGPWINTAGHTWDYLTSSTSTARSTARTPNRVRIKGGRRMVTFDDLRSITSQRLRSRAATRPQDRPGTAESHRQARDDLEHFPRTTCRRHAGCTSGGPNRCARRWRRALQRPRGEGRDAGATRCWTCAPAIPTLDTYHHHDVPPRHPKQGRGRRHAAGRLRAQHELLGSTLSKRRPSFPTTRSSMRATAPPARSY